jgi:peptidoglycan-N-acetylglucosamine deacetylase
MPVRARHKSQRAPLARMARLVPLAAAALAAAFVAGCPSSENVESACSGSQALTALGTAPITGATLAAKQVALTFDDGPGSRTLELSAFLKAEGIRAVFFVNGQCFAAGNPCRFDNAATTAATFLAQLTLDGHLVGNHTQHHWDLTTDATHFPAGATGNAAILKELVDTDAIIAPYVPNNWFTFRAPFGSFGTRPYNVLHASVMDKYVGHVGWDVGSQYVGNDATGFAADWYCWQNAATTSKKCGDRYFNEVKAVGKGIVLLHDADYGNVANTVIATGKGNTIDMVKYLVPLLKAQGYTFVRADEVPALKALLPPVPDAGADAGLDAAVDAADDAAQSSSSSSSGTGSSASSSGDTSSSSSSTGSSGTTPPDPCAPATTNAQAH